MGNLSVKTEVKAENEPEARDKGSYLCRTESQIFEFCSEAMLILDSASGIIVRKKATIKMPRDQMLRLSVIIPSSALTTTQLESALSKTKNALKEKNSVDQDVLKRAIHWHALGKMEFGNKIDRFIKFWIALELLVSNEEGNIVQKVKNALEIVYPELSENIQQDGIIWRYIFAFRVEIFHRGKLLSGDLQDTQLDIDTQLKQTEDIFADILRYKLGLPSRNLARKYYL